LLSNIWLRQSRHDGFAEVVRAPSRVFDDAQVLKELVVEGIVRRATVVDKDFVPKLTRIPGNRLAVGSVTTSFPVPSTRMVSVPSPLSVTL
jgi:hypothetical protein